MLMAGGKRSPCFSLLAAPPSDSGLTTLLLLLSLSLSLLLRCRCRCRRFGGVRACGGAISLQGTTAPAYPVCRPSTRCAARLSRVLVVPAPPPLHPTHPTDPTDPPC